jgi:hypothetical protein
MKIWCEFILTIVLLFVLVFTTQCFAGTLEEDLIQYKPLASDPIHTTSANLRLDSALREISEADSRVAVTLLGRPKFSTTSSLYQETISWCNDLSWYTSEDLSEAAMQIQPLLADKTLRLLSPSVDLSDMPDVTWDWLLDLTETKFSPTDWVYMTDSFYKILTPSGLSRIVDSFDVSFMEYLYQQRDCDDFARAFRGRLSEAGVGNSTIGYLDFSYTKSGSMYYHAVVIILMQEDGEQKFGIYDPQLAAGTFTWLEGQTKYEDFQVRCIIW